MSELTGKERVQKLFKKEPLDTMPCFSGQGEKDVALVEAVIKQCIDNGLDAVWPGCDIWPDIRKENMETYVKTVNEYGKKASPAVGRI